jgi:hypothetical protein
MRPVTKTTTAVEPIMDTSVQYHGIPSSQIKPVFKAACYSRFQEPVAADIIRTTRTTLEPDIVAAILEGALRLLPVDSTPEGQRIRREKEQAKAEHARKAENDFVEHVRRLQPAMLDETQQKQRILAAKESGSPLKLLATPDILFDEPTEINGAACHWIEYKNMFGFKQNPFVQQKIKQQCRRYASLFGAGIIIYRLGFEVRLLDIEGVRVMRERDVSFWVSQQISLQEVRTL